MLHAHGVGASGLAAQLPSQVCAHGHRGCSVGTGRQGAVADMRVRWTSSTHKQSLSSLGTSLTEHKFKDKIIKNFKTAMTEHYTKLVAALTDQSQAGS